jgi:transcription termination factor NusB
MASRRKTLNPLDPNEQPQNKTDVTKDFMLAYIKSEKATDEDRKWFKSIVSNPENHKQYLDQLHGTHYTDIDIPKVRKEFVDRFYPNLNKKEKKKSFIDSILDL